MSIERSKKAFGVILRHSEVTQGHEDKLGKRFLPGLTKKLAPHRRIVKIGTNDRMTVIDSGSSARGGYYAFSSGPQYLTGQEINAPENQDLATYGRVVKTVYEYRPPVK